MNTKKSKTPIEGIGYNKHFIHQNINFKIMKNFIQRNYKRSLAAALFTLASNIFAHATDSTAIQSNNQLAANFDSVKQINAGLLNVGYAEAGPANGQTVILLHGWPYDIHSYTKATALLAAKGYHVYVPYLRGYGTTHFLSSNTVRNGQQSIFAVDIIAFMDALKIKTAIIGGFDWGARTADILAALWPERCKALVSVSGYLIGSQQANAAPLSPQAELAWWYQFYFATERGRKGYQANTSAFAKLIWQTASPQWHFDDSTFDQSAAALDNPDHVAIVIDNYRWRIGVANGEKQYDSIEAKLAKSPVITVPTVTLEGNANGAPHPDPATYRNKFSGKYVHHTLNGIGHNLPEEAPEAFANAIIEAGHLAE